MTLQWEVSHSERYGQPRQVAYKLDTLVINRRLDEQGRPLPKMVCLGSLREIAEELGLGGDTKPGPPGNPAERVRGDYGTAYVSPARMAASAAWKPTSPGIT